MDRKSYIIILIIISLGLISIPFFFDNSTNLKIRVSANIISGFGSLLTLALAILLYKKFGIETSLINKQTKTVFELLENLNTSRIFLSYKNGTMIFNPAKPYYSFYEDHYSKILLFNISYLDGMRYIWKFSESVFLPKVIADQIKKINGYSIIYEQNDTNEEKYLKVNIADYKNPENFKLDEYGLLNEKEISFYDFIHNWNDLIDEIKNWISTNCQIKVELNID